VAKFAATRWKVVVNNVDLSTWAFDVQVADEKEKLEVSGFSATGAREYVQGTAEQEIEISFRWDYAAGGPHQTNYPLYTGGSVFKVWVQPDSVAGTSSTNPWYGGTGSLYSYPMGATLNEVVEYTLSYSPAPNSAFSWGTAGTVS
jgi:hypothetical protein